MSKKKVLRIGLALLMLIVAIGFVWLIFFSSKDAERDNKPEKNKEVFANYVSSYSANGVVTLHHGEDGKQLDKIDLKAQTPHKERKVVIEQSVKNEEEEKVEVEKVEVEKTVENKESVKSPASSNLFKGYEKISKVLKKGENVWSIQSELTPHINTIHLMPLLYEVNKGKSLHPVQPNEERTFLKNVVENEQNELQQKPAVKKEESKIVAPVEKVVKLTLVKKVEDSEFIYYSDPKNKTLYAYSNFANEVYALTVKEGKWNVVSLAEIKAKRDADWLIVNNNRIWLADKSHRHIHVVDAKDSSNATELEAKGEMSEWHVEKDYLHYTYENRMASYDLTKGVINDVVLGDNTLDFVYLKNKFYVLNSFGKNSNNSLLMKVNPQDLKVEDLMELHSNKIAILSHGEEGNLYIGKVEKTKQLDGTITEEPKVVSLELNTVLLEEKSMKWELMFSANMQGWNDHLYAIENGYLHIYPSGEKDAVKKFKVASEQFSIIP